MRRHSQQEVEEAARRRLELLRLELESAGLPPLGESDGHDAGTTEEATVGLPVPAPVPRAGRHARPAAGPSRVAGWLVDRVPETFRGRVGTLGAPALLVLSMVALAVLVGSWALLRSGGDDAAVPAVSSSRPLLPAASRSAVGGAPSATATGTVTVDIAGKVRRPGVATLPAGSRVIDALKHAGGAKGRAHLGGLNLARVLVDGEQVVVGRPAVPGGISASVASGAPQPTGALVNLNTATADQLDTLPGVGPVTAEKILQWRAEHGAFSSVDELLEIDGIGEKTFADLAPLVTL